MKKIVTLEDAKEMVKEIIINKKTYTQLAEEYNCSKDTCYRRVKDLKKKYDFSETINFYFYLKIFNLLDEVEEKYKKGISTCKIGKEYGVTNHTVANALREYGVQIRGAGKISKTDQTLFQTIKTAEEAYTIGLITADGNMTQDENSIFITLTQGDKYVLELIKEKVFGGTAHLVISHKEDKKPRWTLQAHGKQLCKNIKQYGIFPNKSLLIKELSKAIPEEFYSDYIRGLYDGDGVCSFSTSHGKQHVRIGYCSGSLDFLESYRNFMVQKLDLNKNKIFNTRNCWQVSWSARQDLENFYSYIYRNNPQIFLGRKKQKLYNYINTEITCSLKNE